MSLIIQLSIEGFPRVARHGETQSWSDAAAAMFLALGFAFDGLADCRCEEEEGQG